MGNLSHLKHYSLLSVLLIITISSPVAAQLTPTFYALTCPTLSVTVRLATQAAILANPRNGASLIRLFFHDCFVNGCEAGLLLDETTPGAGDSEKTQPGNDNSLRGFEVIDTIKTQVDAVCGRGVVSCADILALAARDSLSSLGGLAYIVSLGRRDALTASPAQTTDLVGFFEDLPSILNKFSAKGFTATETVALSGGHTVGQARCVTFRDRIYNEANIDPAFATSLQANCPRAAGTGDNNLAPFGTTPNIFGNSYFQQLVNRRGLLHTDQALFNGAVTDAIVQRYSDNPVAFATEFANAMVKLGNLSPLTGTQGEIRANCRRRN